MKKNIFFIMLLSIIMFSCSNQKSEVSYLHELDYIPVSENYNECYYIDIKTGKKAKNTQTYEYASYFYDDIAIVKKGGTYRFIDKNFKFISSDEYSQVTIFNENIAYAVKPSGQIEAINKQGKTIFTLKNAEKAYLFNDGISIFETENNTFGVVDTKGNILFETENRLESNKNGMIKIAKKTNAGIKYGIIDYSNNEIIPCEYDNIDFTNKNDIFLVENDDKIGAINIKNKEIIPLEHDGLFSQIDGNYLFIKQYQYGNLKFGWLNHKGEEIIEPQFNEAIPFIWGNLTPAVDENGKVGYINKKGKWIIEPKYKYAENFFENGLAIVENPNTEEYGIINKSNEFVIKAQYDDLVYLGHDLYYAEDGNKEGIINSKGKEVIKMNDIYAYEFPFLINESLYPFINSDNFTETTFTKYVYSEYLDVASIVNDMINDIQKLKMDSLTISQLESKFDITINEYFVGRGGERMLSNTNNKYYSTTITTFIYPRTEYSFYDGYQTTYEIESIGLYFRLYGEKVHKHELQIINELAKKLGINYEIVSSGQREQFEQNIIPGHFGILEGTTIYFSTESPYED